MYAFLFQTALGTYAERGGGIIRNVDTAQDLEVGEHIMGEVE